MIYKSIAFGILISLSFNVAALNSTNENAQIDNEYSLVLLDLVLTVTKNCYKGPQQTCGKQLVKCVGDLFIQEVPNPHAYKLRISGDCPGDVDLILYNPQGNMITCYITLDKIVNVNHCISYKVPPLTKGQEMSITPPKVLVK